MWMLPQGRGLLQGEQGSPWASAACIMCHPRSLSTIAPTSLSFHSPTYNGVDATAQIFCVRKFPTDVRWARTSAHRQRIHRRHAGPEACDCCAHQRRMTWRPRSSSLRNHCMCVIFVRVCTCACVRGRWHARTHTHTLSSSRHSAYRVPN